METIGSLVAQKAFESKVETLSKDLTSGLGLDAEDGEREDEKRKYRPPTREEREAGERREREREEAHQKRREKSQAKANALREKYGLPTTSNRRGEDRFSSSSAPYRSSSNPSAMAQCCTLY